VQIYDWQILSGIPQFCPQARIQFFDNEIKKGPESRIQSLRVDLIWNFTCDRNQVVRLQVRLKVDKRFDRNEGKRRGSVDHLHAWAVPMAAVQSGAFPLESICSTHLTAHSPEAHLLYTP
jgi:hypothetical protein